MTTLSISLDDNVFCSSEQKPIINFSPNFNLLCLSVMAQKVRDRCLRPSIRRAYLSRHVLFGEQIPLKIPLMPIILSYRQNTDSFDTMHRG